MGRQGVAKALRGLFPGQKVADIVPEAIDAFDKASDSVAVVLITVLTDGFHNAGDDIAFGEFGVGGDVDLEVIHNGVAVRTIARSVFANAAAAAKDVVRTGCKVFGEWCHLVLMNEDSGRLLFAFGGRRGDRFFFGFLFFSVDFRFGRGLRIVRRRGQFFRYQFQWW